MKSNTPRLALPYFFFLSYLALLALALDTIKLKEAWDTGGLALGFIVVSWLCYSFYYLLPSLLLTWLTKLLLPRRPAYAYGMAIITTSLTSLFLYANAKLFALYGMFINSFIINLVTTPGGIASLGGSQSSQLGMGMIVVGFVVLHIILLALSLAMARRSKTAPWRWRRAVIPLVIVSTLGIHLTYAFNDAMGKSNITSLAESVPFFHPITAKSLCKRLGFKPVEHAKLHITGRLNYPLQPFAIQAPAKPYNIIWLTAESWRADMLTAEIMPNTWRFAQEAQKFNQNYSGGNGTRMGVFSMFTGLPGNYWFPFMRDHRGAAIIDVLQQQHYQMSLYTSAMFSYPEFDRALFSHVPPKSMQSLQGNGQPGWMNDRQNISDMLDFISKRNPAQPFFNFMFFESPHARYHFPEESVIRRPYKDDINYATLSKQELRQDIEPIRNRYINAVHHLDSQFGRVFDYLKQHQLLDSTIVILVGDHGEEFMEHGYWGHNSTFVNEQVRTPLVLWLPGVAAQEHNAMTSHMDIIPTLMPYLGVQNPSTDYTLGHDLMHGQKRDYTYISDWSRIAYLDAKVKATMNLDGYASTQFTSPTDADLSASALKQAQQNQASIMLNIMHDLSKFLKNNKT